MTPPTATRTYELEMRVPVGDPDTFLATIAYAYDPGVPARTNCLPEDADPGEPSEVEVLSVLVGGIDILPVLDDRVLVSIEQACDADGEKRKYEGARR